MTDKKAREIINGIKDGLKSVHADNALAAALQDLLVLRAVVRRYRFLCTKLDPMGCPPEKYWVEWAELCHTLDLLVVEEKGIGKP